MMSINSYMWLYLIYVNDKKNKFIIVRSFHPSFVLCHFFSVLLELHHYCNFYFDCYTKKKNNNKTQQRVNWLL